jgi:dTDP-4-amino-4,6-dideoxygalactose transaminase
VSEASRDSSQTRRTLRRVERDLLDQTRGVHVEWCGRAATALYWAYQLARKAKADSANPEVILPAISCATPANTAILAGLKPRFADVDPRTGMPPLSAIERRRTAATCAVVFVHLYGQAADLAALAEWCRQHGVLLIEDVAQALGARLPSGRPAGSVGDLGVYSFSPTKLLECGGGALVVRSEADARLLHELLRAQPLPPEPTTAVQAQLALSYRNLHHALVSLFRLRVAAPLSELFLQVRPAYDALYLERMLDPEPLAATWPTLPAVLERRRRKAELYSEGLSSGPWATLDGWRDSGVCWRYTLLTEFPEQTVAFCERVRADGFHVSNLYWPPNQFFKPEDACPNAEEFARRVVNLWVDDSVDEAWVRRCVASVRKHAACEPLTPKLE